MSIPEQSGNVVARVVGIGVLLTAAGGAWYFLRGGPHSAQMPAGSDAQPAANHVSTEIERVDSIAASGSLADCSLLLVTLDTTRPDHIGCYGNGKIETPTMDRLATEGVIFSAATAVAPLTLPSHTSILTGLYPSSHGVRTNGFFRLEEGPATLAERLHSAGFKTAAFPSAFVLDSQFGLARGFDHYDDSLVDSELTGDKDNPSRTANHTTDLAIRWLDENESGRFFLWVHYFDPHYIYSPPSPFREHYAGAPYDGEIAFVDSELGRLLDSIEDLGLAEKCLTVVVGDHGEALGEHNEPTHAYQVYEGTLKIPLLMHCGTRLGGGVHFPQRASQVDVMPTVLSLLGLDPVECDGVALTERLPANRPVFFETLAGTLEYGWEPLVGVLQGPNKYIYSSAPELYDLIQDPAEQHNLISSQADKAAELDHVLRSQLGSELELELAHATTPTVQPSSGDLEALQALGYLGGGASEVMRLHTGFPRR